jgi:ABC-type branched-subunit amino acid transport system ATPase component
MLPKVVRRKTSQRKNNGDAMLLEVNNLNAGYGFLQILRDLSLNVDQGEYVCLVGPNGAGKSTTLKTIAGLVKPMSGEILFKGEPIGGLPGNLVARKGIAFVSEEMNLFVNMTVNENLAMGAYTIKDKQKQKDRLEFVYDLFPRLVERRNQLAGTMSGGERKMLAIGRGLMSDPTLLLVDEPSFGLAPLLTENVFQSLDTLVKQGMTIMLVEQNVTKTLAVTDRGYVLENGRIELKGKSSDLACDDHVRKVFLGV